jgi:hypothetical protein
MLQPMLGPVSLHIQVGRIVVASTGEGIVDVVDLLAWQKPPTQYLLGDEAMFIGVAAYV